MTFKHASDKALVLDLADIAELADPNHGEIALALPWSWSSSVGLDFGRVWRRRRIDCCSADPELCRIWQYTWVPAGSCRRAADTGGEDLEDEKLYVLSALRHLYNLPTMTASKSFLYPKL
jgi:hypothetical protein